MRIQQLLEHHGISRNPFAEEDAQTDPVFKEHCIADTYHPTWDKVFGDPGEPATSIVFGEKGSGKTAMRLQIARRLNEYNEQHAGQRMFVIHYDDFNPFLDRFRDRLSRRRKPEKVLAEWKLWDHMDAILTLGVTGLVDRLLEVKQPARTVDCSLDGKDIQQLERSQARDLLLLAAWYDQSTAETFKDRWQRLRKRLRFSAWRSQWDLAAGWATTGGVLALMITIAAKGGWDWIASKWMLALVALLMAGGWSFWMRRCWRCFWLARGVLKHMRIGNHETNPLRRALMSFASAEMISQPVPNKDRTDDRYELICKLQGVLQTLGHKGIIVLVDRVDEPHMINGSDELMKALIWPMLDNKFLKHPGLGLKLMLPAELNRFVDREDREFYQRSRLDKQNMIPSFEWTGEALYDVANARIQACAEDGEGPGLRKLFADGLSDKRLIEAFRQLRVPRHLFKFLYRLLVQHCNSHTEESPVWEVSAETFESTLALYSRDQDAFDRGLGAG